MKKPTWKATRKERTHGSQLGAIIFAVAGLCGLAVFWPIGVVLLLVAIAIEPRSKKVSICAYCGNDVSPTSVLCPVCGADEATAIAEEEAIKTKR
jgi:hypothetical protein